MATQPKEQQSIKLYTVEWDNDYPEFQLKASYAVTRSLEDAFKITNKLNAVLHQVTPEEIAEAEGMPVEQANGSIRIEEYIEESAGPTRWFQYNAWLKTYKM